jgi:hypothetical protein
MADDVPTPEQMVPAFLHAFMWASAFGVVEEFRAHRLWSSGGLLVAALAFHILGIKWAQIKPNIRPHVAAAFERIASNLLYHRAIYSVTVIAILASIAFGIYRHYYPPPIQSTATDTSGPLVPLQPLQSLTVSPVKLVFRDQPIGKTSGAQTVTVINQGTAPRIITGINITGNFSQTNDCGPELMTGDSCDVEVKFTPTTLGLTYGNLAISCKDPLFYSVDLTATVNFSGSGETSPALPMVQRGPLASEPKEPGRPSSKGAIGKPVVVVTPQLSTPSPTTTQGQAQAAAAPPSIIPEDPVKAVEVVDRMRKSLTVVIGRKDTVTFLITWPKDDNSNLVFVSNLISQACRESPRQCWFTQEGNPQDLDKPPVQASGRPGITVHGPDAYALANALGAWFITHSTSTLPPELNGYNEYHTKEIMWVEIGPGSLWKPTTK